MSKTRSPGVSLHGGGEGDRPLPSEEQQVCGGRAAFRLLQLTVRSILIDHLSLTVVSHCGMPSRVSRCLTSSYFVSRCLAPSYFLSHRLTLSYAVSHRLTLCRAVSRRLTLSRAVSHRLTLSYAVSRRLALSHAAGSRVVRCLTIPGLCHDS